MTSTGSWLRTTAALAKAYGVPNPASKTAGVASSFIGPTWGADISGGAIRGLIIFLVLQESFLHGFALTRDK